MWARAGKKRACIGRGAFAHADQTLATRALSGHRPASVVDDAQGDLRRFARDGNVGARGLCVLEDVGQRLLHDPVAGELDAWWQTRDGSAQVHVDMHAGFAD